MVVSANPRRKAHLELEGRAPVPFAFRSNAWFRSDGSLIVEGRSSLEEDWTLMIGARGRIDIDDAGPKLGVRIAATDHARGIVRFVVQPRIIS
ncbi:hypothetical protein KL86PLE_90415 [uncultured Pleomorphomonas sp.]|uniref:Uncharacterized protein n=2 Tax=Pleomorphomonas TaxID=261933 RepID=A0A2G9WQI7_9HYPH|nr:hypothetical protein [Pleomorphomonas carboxyditropha]PIO96981.1 hypothetical protein CJ014_22875 [Pleomorphomonas carboxyditropha]SCM79463.1 hypothetical protein KL86PLE_90415 [uncultured Pleomorphomonas sp.]